MTTISNWLESIWSSSENLSWYINRANWGLAIALGITFFLTIAVIKLTTRKDFLDRQEISGINKVTADTKERAENLERGNLLLRADVAKLETDAAEARTRQAEAEKLAAEAMRKSRPRLFDFKKFISELKDVPKGRIEVAYKSDDDEVSILTGQINRWLGPGQNGDGAGWEIVRVRPLSEGDAFNGGYPSWTPLATRAGAWSGLGIMVRHLPPMGEEMFENNVFKLMLAFQSAGIAAGPIGSDPRMPDGLIRIVVGPKLY